MAGAEVDLIAIGDHGISGAGAGLAIHPQLLNNHRTLINSSEEGAGVDIVSLSLVGSKVGHLSVDSIYALFQTSQTASICNAGPNQCLAVDPSLNTNVFNTVDHNVLDLVLKQDVIAKAELPEFPIGVAVNVCIVAVAGQGDAIVGETQHQTVGPFRVLDGATEVEHNNVMLLDVQNHGYLLIIYILRSGQALTGMADTHRLSQQLAGGGALNSNGEALFSGVAEGVTYTIDHSLHACSHRCILAAGQQVSNMLGADDLDRDGAGQLAVLSIHSSSAGQNHGFTCVDLQILLAAQSQLGSDLVAISNGNSEGTVTLVVIFIHCQIYQCVSTGNGGGIAAADIYLSAIGLYHINRRSLFACESSIGDRDRFVCSKDAGNAEVYINSGRSDVNTKLSFACIINDKALDAHMIVIVRSLVAIGIHGQPACAGLIPQLCKQLVGQNAFIDCVACDCLENKVSIVVADSGSLIDPAVNIDSSVSSSCALANVLPLYVQGMILAVQQRLIITLNLGHFLIAALLNTGLNSAGTDSQEQVGGPSAGFLVGHSVAVLAATGCQGVEHLSIHSRSICIEGNCYILVVDLGNIFSHTNSLIQTILCGSMAEGYQTELVDPRHTVLLIQCEVLGIQSQVHFTGLADLNRNFISRFKSIACCVLYGVDQYVVTCGNTHNLHIGKVFPFCEQNGRLLAAHDLVQAGSDQAGDIDITGLINSNCGGQLHIGSSCALDNSRSIGHSQGTGLIVSNSSQSVLCLCLIAGGILNNISNLVNQELVRASIKGLLYITGLLVDQITVDGYAVFLHLRNCYLDVGGNITVYIVGCGGSRYSNLIANLASFRNAGNSNDGCDHIRPNRGLGGVDRARQPTTGSQSHRHHCYHYDSQ